MKIIQCEHGHYYDAEKFETCPHCQIEQNEANVTMSIDSMPSATEVGSSPTEVNTSMDNEVTVPVNESVEPEPTPNAANILRPELEMPFHGSQQPAQQYTPQPPVQQYSPQPPIQPPVQQYPAVQQYAPQPPIQPPASLEGLVQRAREQSNIPHGDNPTVRLTESERIANPTVGWLIGMNNGYYGVCFDLKRGKNFVGRGYDMDVVLENDMSVSRSRHAIIIYEPRARVFIAQPGESRELFYLNDEVVLQNESLKPYDVLSIGKTNLLFFPLCGESFSWDELTTEKE